MMSRFLELDMKGEAKAKQGQSGKTVSFIDRKLPYVPGSRVQLVLKMKLGLYL